MPDYSLPQEHTILRQTVREFAEVVIAPQAQELDRTETFSVEITQKMWARSTAARGWTIWPTS